MAGTLLCPLTCGFVKVAAYSAFISSKDLAQEKNEGSSKYQARKIRLRFDKYNEFFGEELESGFLIPFQTFTKKFPDFLSFMQKWKSRKKGDKETFLKHFSLECWNKLSKAKKREHQLQSCKGCFMNHSDMQAVFPVRSKYMKKFTRENPFVAANDMLRKEKSAAPLKPKALQEVTLKVYNAVNNSFQSTLGTDFATAMTKVNQLGVQQRITKAAKKKERKHNLRCSKKAIEQNWRDTDVDCFLQTRQSLGKRQTQRLLSSCESKENAKQRASKRKREEAGLKARKRHSPDPNKIEFDKESLLTEVTGMEDGNKVKKKCDGQINGSQYILQV